jgi:hypothetical protein
VRAPDSTVGDHYQRSEFSYDEVFLLGRTPDSRSIVAHEIGHAIMDDIYEDAYPATPNCSGHTVDHVDRGAHALLGVVGCMRATGYTAKDSGTESASKARMGGDRSCRPGAREQRSCGQA